MRNISAALRSIKRERGRLTATNIYVFRSFLKYRLRNILVSFSLLWSCKEENEKLFFKLSSIWPKDEILFGNCDPKPSCLHVRGLHNACGVGSSRMEKGTISAERYIQVLEQHFGKTARKQILHPSQQHYFAEGEGSAWGLPEVQKTNKQANKQTKKTPKIWQTVKWKMLHPTSMGEFFSSQNYGRRGLHFLDLYRPLLQVGQRRGHTMINLTLSDPFWDLLLSSKTTDSIFQMKWL